MKKVIARAPTRIDLAGGTLDLWPIHNILDHKTTVNASISLEAETVITKSPDKSFHLISKDQELSFSGNLEEASTNRKLPLLGILLKAYWQNEHSPITIQTSAKSPAGSGLGGSSCLAITVATALSKSKQFFDNSAIDIKSKDLIFNEKDLVNTVQNIEARIINSPTGCQDYWGAVRGGINVIRFPFTGAEVTTSSTASIKSLRDELILCYCGKSRASALNNWEIFRRFFEGDQNLFETLGLIGEVASLCGDAVLKGDYEKVLSYSKKEWDLRCQLWPHITTDETDRIDQAARKAGAKFSRVCGAGGGGVMAIFSPVEKRSSVIEALKKAGGQVLDGTIIDQGLFVTIE